MVYTNIYIYTTTVHRLATYAPIAPIVYARHQVASGMSFRADLQLFAMLLMKEPRSPALGLRASCDFGGHRPSWCARHSSIVPSAQREVSP